MATNKILPWAQTGTANVLSDDAYAADVASGGLYGDGVKTGQASSKQANKTWRQATAPGSGLGQFLVDNLNVDVTDSDTPATFSSRIANAILKLAQISPFNQSWAVATGGYRKYAIVSDSSGNFWVSTTDQNVTVPGMSGANWQNLFNGYATQAWANGQFLQLADTETQTVTGPVTFSSTNGRFAFQSDGNCIFYTPNGTPMFSVGSSRMMLYSNMEAHFNGVTYVPSVTDWTTKQAVPASDADARYAHNGAAFTIGNTTESGINNVIKYGTQCKFKLQNDDNAVFYDNLGPFCSFRRDGSIFRTPITVPDVTDFTGENALNAKTAEGRYATNTALQSEASSRASADTNLQNQINDRVQKTGDTSSGWQYNRNKYDDGTLHWGAGWTSVIAGMSGGSSNGEYSFGMWAQELDGSYTAGILSLNGFQGRKDFRFNEDGNIYTPLGTVALKGDLPLPEGMHCQVFYTPIPNPCPQEGWVVNIPRGWSTHSFVTACDTGGNVYAVAANVENNTQARLWAKYPMNGAWAMGGEVTVTSYGYF